MEEDGDLVGVSNALHLLYEIEYRKGNHPEAKKLYDQSLDIKRKLESNRNRDLKEDHYQKDNENRKPRL